MTHPDLHLKNTLAPFRRRLCLRRLFLALHWLLIAVMLVLIGMLLSWAISAFV